jgi:hypothetical protein
VGLNLNTSVAWKGRRDVILDRLSYAEVSWSSAGEILHALLGGTVVSSSVCSEILVSRVTDQLQIIFAVTSPNHNLRFRNLHVVNVTLLLLLAAEEVSTHCCNLLDVEAGVTTANRKYTSFDMDQQFCYGINEINR